jgi:gamma-glutamyl hydrolase
MMHHMVFILRLMMSGIIPWWFMSSTQRDSDHSVVSSLHSVPPESTANDGVLVAVATPVIGILAQPLHTTNPSNGSDQQQQFYYIAASYVKWLEAGGARSISIPYDTQSTVLLDELFQQINGLLLPGGDAVMPYSIRYLLDKVMESNRNGNYFPVWGTCLGFEFLIQYVGGDDAIQHGFNASNISLPLLIDSATYTENSQLYNDINIYHSVTNYPITMNNHHQGIEPQWFIQNDALARMWYTTSTNYDLNHRPFVSTIEPRYPNHFPLYGVQYHPEKNAFEYATYPNTNIPYESIDHTAVGVAFSISMAQYFVDLVRYGQEHNPYHDYTKVDQFPTIATTYPIQTGIQFEEIYIVPNASTYDVTTTN